MPEAKRSREFCGEDRISALSDDLLTEILLLVPTKVAVATTVLSKRWRFIWTKLPRLEYKDDLKSNKSSVWWFLDESMRFHNAPILETLCIELGPQCPVDVDVVKWVAKAVDSSLRKLTFKLLWNSKPTIMPNSLYTCKTLTRLVLFGKILVDLPSQVSLPSLRQLHLVSVVYKDEDSHVKLLSSCPVLEHLIVLRRGDVDDNVRNFTVKVPSLVRLTYWITAFQENDDGSLIIESPDVTYLSISGDLRKSSSIDMPRLREAHIYAVFNPNDKILRSVSSIMYLDLHPFDTMVPWCNVVYSQLLKFRLCRFQPDWCEPLLVFLSNCPKLKDLEVESILENHHPVSWNKPSSVPKCLSSHLEIFEWKGYAGREDEKEVIRYILENSKCLKKVGISMNTTTCNNLEEKQKMMEDLESIPRVSSCLLSFKELK